jgi:hypothetical protein
MGDEEIVEKKKMNTDSVKLILDKTKKGKRRKIAK